MTRLYEVLEHALDYLSHSELCGCADEEHARAWTIPLTLTERDVREMLSCVRVVNGR